MNSHENNNEPPPHAGNTMMDGGPILIFVVFAIVAIIAGIFSWISRNRQREELAALAARLGLKFNSADDESFANGWGFLDKLNHGRDRYAYNMLSGDFNGHRVFAFHYHYKTGSGKDTQHHRRTFFMLVIRESFPQLTIAPEGVFSKIAQAFGYDDIDFESAEFSRAFCVRSKDKKFAYDVCNPQMIEYLLSNRKLDLEIQGPALLIEFIGELPAADFAINLRRLVEIRLRLPDYLFTKA